jgi:hypothetical protein
MSEATPWHWLFGLSLMDFFRGQPVSVEMEKDLSLRLQLLDVVLIRVIVVRELPQEEPNAVLHLFSARTDLLGYGATHYHLRSGETSTLLLELFKRYHQEATLMPDMLEEFAREKIEQLLKELPVEKRLKGLSPDELLAALSPEMRAALAQRLKDDGSTSNPEAGEPGQGERKG